MVNTYENPLITRYSSKEMQVLLSSDYKYKTWRKLWVALAKAEQKAGLNITDQQISDMEANVQNIDYLKVAELEEKLQHEVMAHIKAFALVAPSAEPIIHLGETSAYVLDNTDIIIAKEALKLLSPKILNLIKELIAFIKKYKNLPTLSFTHLQPAQPITLGKRACLWLNSLINDYKELLTIEQTLKLRGVKGTTGSAASFKQLLNGDYIKLKQIEQNVSKEMGFTDCYSITSQTYDRKIDVTIANLLSNIAISSHKISNDLRILQSMGECEEPFKEKQVGSSAMPYKRNPMLLERVSALAKFAISLSDSTVLVASTQWLERTLDDSANKRLVLPQVFLAVDSIIILLIKIISGLQVNEKVIAHNLKQKLPFMISENILMEYVKNGGDRQRGHEKIREYSLIANKRIKEEGLSNNLVELIVNDQDFKIDSKIIESLQNPQNLIGFSLEQIDDFLENEVYPLLNQEPETNLNKIPSNNN